MRNECRWEHEAKKANARVSRGEDYPSRRTTRSPWLPTAKRSWRSGATRGIAVLFGAMWLSGCAVGPNYVKPEVPTSGKFEALSSSVYSEEGTVAQFWTQFKDPTLDKLIADSLDANHDLRIALARFTEARAARGGSPCAPPRSAHPRRDRPRRSARASTPGAPTSTPFRADTARMTRHS